MAEFITEWMPDSHKYMEAIVRCRDCDSASFDEFGGGWCYENGREIKAWNFCAWPERRTEQAIAATLGSDAANQPNSESVAQESGESAENDTAKMQIRDFDDTREKLEADIWSGCDHLTMMNRGECLVNVPLRRLHGWLDRQAAITERELWKHFPDGAVNAAFHREERAKWKKENAELQAKVDELTERNEYLESRHCEWSDPDSLGDGCMLRKDEYVDGLKAKIAELQFEADKLTAECISLEKQRDHWHHVASKHAAEMQKLRKEKDELQSRLDSEEQHAREAWEIIPQWPRFEDGAPVRFGDIGLDVHGHPRKVDGVRFYPSGGVYITDDSGNAWWGNDTGPSEDPDIDPYKRVKLPPMPHVRRAVAEGGRMSGTPKDPKQGDRVTLIDRDGIARTFLVIWVDDDCVVCDSGGRLAHFGRRKFEGLFKEGD